MKSCVLSILIAASMLPGRNALGQTYRLPLSAFGSIGGVSTGTSAFHLGMTAGQAVTGVGSGPATPLYAESVGFWIWAHLPVLDVSEPGHGPETGFGLSPGAPNPFALATTIRYAISPASGPVPVTVRIYDLSSRLVRTLDSGTHDPGPRVVAWDGRDDAGNPLRNGLYFCRLEAGGRTASRRLILIR